MARTDRLQTALALTLSALLFWLFWASYGLDGALTAMIALCFWVGFILWLCNVWGAE